jgi:hypothetical protein
MPNSMAPTCAHRLSVYALNFDASFIDTSVLIFNSIYLTPPSKMFQHNSASCCIFKMMMFIVYLAGRFATDNPLILITDTKTKVGKNLS